MTSLKKISVDHFMMVAWTRKKSEAWLRPLAYPTQAGRLVLVQSAGKGRRENASGVVVHRVGNARVYVAAAPKDFML